MTVDEFGLPLKSFPATGSGAVTPTGPPRDQEKTIETVSKKDSAPATSKTKPAAEEKESKNAVADDPASDSDDADFKDAQSEIDPESNVATPITETPPPVPVPSKLPQSDSVATIKASEETTGTGDEEASVSKRSDDAPATEEAKAGNSNVAAPAAPITDTTKKSETAPQKPSHNRDVSLASITTSVGGVSEFSHQQLQVQEEETPDDEDSGWQEMPSFARYDMYNDDNKLIAREMTEEDDQTYGYGNLGGAGKGYTRVLMDEDAESATSMDENTQYLFKDVKGTNVNDDDARDAMGQMQATKDLLTEGQRIAYVGVARLEIAKLIKEGEAIELNKKAKKQVTMSVEALRMWGQKIMLRIYSHMDISEAEQVMIEQLAEHGVQPSDLTPTLHANSRVHNPMAESDDGKGTKSAPMSPTSPDDELPAEAPPPYQMDNNNAVPDAQTPAQLPTTEKIDIDLRWTVLCDLFLLLIADSVYDSRSRVLLERVGASLDVEWIDICRFEKRVTDALEMQQEAEKENWNEDEHMEERRKKALKKRYVMMGLATVGGGLVIGLSAGLLAPVIGAGLAAGFTTIGVGGTGSFLAGAGGAAIITSSAAASGSFIGVRAANRRTGAVKTFEYRPLHNNKRVNLIVTVSGWLTGKMDDVRLPFSTVDPIMGDIYSILWEPEMLRSMGDTINILATEALTQGLQQILGSTILISLMAALQLPLVLTKLSYLIDNPWAVSLDRATAAGLILADSLIERSLGTRPITLVGYSLGSRVIFSCLQELAKKGAYGLVQNVYIFGSPVVVKKEEYIRARTVVSGRFVNGYNRNDWILGYLFRLTNGGIRSVAGLAPIEDLPWLENMDVTDLVKGHMEYRAAMPSLLIKCGWTVTSEEFSEIEDPDPENHQERQRELINEIEEARKELEKEGKASKGGRFSIFGRRKKERQEWEVYEDQSSSATAGAAAGATAAAATSSTDGGTKSPAAGDNPQGGVLFDIDAIRAELAKEAEREKEAGGAGSSATGDGVVAEDEKFVIREIKTTLPPMKLDISPVTPSTAATSPLGQGGNAGGVLGARSVSESRLPETKKSVSGFQPYPESGLAAYHSEPDFGEEQVQMTFDTSFEDGPGEIYGRESGGPSVERLDQHQLAVPGAGGASLANMTIADPWADPDDGEFGQEEGEISMTFA